MTRPFLHVLGLIVLCVLCGPARADDGPGEPPLPGEMPAGQKEGAPVGEPTTGKDREALEAEIAQEVATRRAAEATAAAEAGMRIMRLSLQDAVKMGAEANLGLLAGSYEPAIAFQGLIGADANFDYLLTAGIDVSRNESPINNVFQGEGGQLLQKNVNAFAGVTKNLRSGGTASLLYRADRINTNNPFALLNPSWQQGAVLEAVQPLLRGAGDIALADIRRAQNSVAAARAGYDAQAQDTILNVIAAYWELVFLEINLAARRQGEEVARELLNDAEARLDAEVGTPLDVAEARAGVERRVSEVLESENLRATVQDQLLALILPFAPGQDSRIFIIPTDVASIDYTSLPVPSEEQRYVSLAIAGRPELREQKANIATRGVDVVVAHNAIRPQLDVVGSVGTQGLAGGYGAAFRDMADGRAVSGAIGLEFSLFIGQRQARSSWLAAAWRRRQAQIGYKELENQIIREVRLALRNIQTARGQVSAGRAEVKAAVENVVGERMRLDQGKSTPFQVLLKVNEMTDAQTRLGRAAANVRVAQSELWRAVGTLVKQMGVDVSRWKPCRDCR